jgi:putative peptidoglycan lipid II flippase
MDKQMHATARGIALAALLIAVGNIASRVLGLGRESVVAFFFGRGPDVDAFAAASTITTIIYDLLINGAISAALVPVFSEFVEGERREFSRIVSSIITIALLMLSLIVALMVWQAPLVVRLLLQESHPELRPLTIQLVRLLLPALLFMGLAGLMTAVLFARRAFLLPAFNGAIFNMGIIVGAVLLHQRLGILSLAVGTLLGALFQVVLQAPGLRGLRYRPMLHMNHPVVRRILRLYAPVALGIAFSIIGALVDRWLASGFPKALGTMRFATTLIQFPLGLIGAAVSLAVLPTLSRQDADDDREAFRQTLGMGLKVVLLLVIPAAAGLAALATPLTAFIFEGGEFTAQDTAAVAMALLLYLPSLPAAAIDQVLIFTFYARKNTLAPNLVQGAAVGIYLVTSLSLLALFAHLGFLALVIGNSAQWIGHALIMLWLLRRGVSLVGLRLGEALLKALVASAAMALFVAWLARFGAAAGLAPWAQVLLGGGAGVLVYAGLSMLLRVEALGFFVDAVVRKLRGRGGKA